MNGSNRGRKHEDDHLFEELNDHIAGEDQDIHLNPISSPLIPQGAGSAAAVNPLEETPEIKKIKAWAMYLIAQTDLAERSHLVAKDFHSVNIAILGEKLLVAMRDEPVFAEIKSRLVASLDKLEALPPVLPPTGILNLSDATRAELAAGVDEQVKKWLKKGDTSDSDLGFLGSDDQDVVGLVGMKEAIGKGEAYVSRLTLKGEKDKREYRVGSVLIAKANGVCETRLFFGGNRKEFDALPHTDPAVIRLAIIKVKEHFDLVAKRINEDNAARLAKAPPEDALTEAQIKARYKIFLKGNMPPNLVKAIQALSLHQGYTCEPGKLNNPPTPAFVDADKNSFVAALNKPENRALIVSANLHAEHLVVLGLGKEEQEQIEQQITDMVSGLSPEISDAPASLSQIHEQPKPEAPADEAPKMQIAKGGLKVGGLVAPEVGLTGAGADAESIKPSAEIIALHVRLLAAVSRGPAGVNTEELKSINTALLGPLVLGDVMDSRITAVPEPDSVNAFMSNLFGLYEKCADKEAFYKLVQRGDSTSQHIGSLAKMFVLAFHTAYSLADDKSLVKAQCVIYKAVFAWLNKLANTPDNDEFKRAILKPMLDSAVVQNHDSALKHADPTDPVANELYEVCLKLQGAYVTAGGARLDLDLDRDLETRFDVSLPPPTLGR